MPAQYHRSVTILMKDSGLADALSTALFNMSTEDGKALIEKINNGQSNFQNTPHLSDTPIEAMWIEADGTKITTPVLPNISKPDFRFPSRTVTTEKSTLFPGNPEPFPGPGKFFEKNSNLSLTKIPCSCIINESLEESGKQKTNSAVAKW